MTSAVTMQLEKGSAGFQPAASGILPDADGAWTSHRSVLRITRPSRRLEAGGGGQDGRAHLFDLHRSGSGKMPLKTGQSPEPEAPRKLAGGAASTEREPPVRMEKQRAPRQGRGNSTAPAGAGASCWAIRWFSLADSLHHRLISLGPAGPQRRAEGPATCQPRATP